MRRSFLFLLLLCGTISPGLATITQTAHKLSNKYVRYAYEWAPIPGFLEKCARLMALTETDASHIRYLYAAASATLCLDTCAVMTQQLTDLPKRNIVGYLMLLSIAHARYEACNDLNVLFGSTTDADMLSAYKKQLNTYERNTLKKIQKKEFTQLISRFLLLTIILWIVTLQQSRFVNAEDQQTDEYIRILAALHIFDLLYPLKSQLHIAEQTLLSKARMHFKQYLQH